MSNPREPKENPYRAPLAANRPAGQSTSATSDRMANPSENKLPETKPLTKFDRIFIGSMLAMMLVGLIGMGITQLTAKPAAPPAQKDVHSGDAEPASATPKTPQSDNPKSDNPKPDK